MKTIMMFHDSYPSNSTFKSICIAMRSVLCVCMLLLMHQAIIAQTCDYTIGEVSFEATDQNESEAYQTIYVLSDAEGIILDTSHSTSFTIEEEGLFWITAFNFEIETGIMGLSIGALLDNVTGECIDQSELLPVAVCAEIEPCHYCVGDDIDVSAEGGNMGDDYTTRYVLTDNRGTIIAINDTPDFGGLDTGLYIVFAVNWLTGEGIVGLDTSAVIHNISGECFDISAGLPISVCGDFDANINLANANCDIRDSARLEVDGDFATYLWSTGETTPTIAVPATEVQSYSVTVTTEAGCEGIDSFDFTAPEISSVGDFVWTDTDLDGIQDMGEAGMNGVVVNLYEDNDQDGIPDNDTPICSTVTTTSPDNDEMDGFYNFDVYAGDYIIEIELPDGLQATTPNSGDDDALDSDINQDGLSPSISVGEGENLTNIDAGLAPAAVIMGLVWNDRNGNGAREEGETGRSNILVRIYQEDGTILDSTIVTTDPETGVASYSFDNLPTGDYYVEIVYSDSLVLSPPDMRVDDTIDSDADGSNGPNTTPNYTLNAGDTISNVDFGIYTGGVICGVVWQENNENPNNVYDMGVDQAIADAEMQLVSEDSDSVITTVFTDDMGNYCFIGVPRGNYRIRPLVTDDPNNFLDQNVGEDPLVDSDIDPNTRLSDVVIIMPETIIEGLNSGYRSDVVVPIELLFFEGEWQPASQIISLEWATAVELINDRFEIERSEEGVVFEKIGQLNGQGTSYENNYYQYEDQNVEAGKLYYYRLKQLDFNGDFSYSSIIEINIPERLTNIQSLKVYPNPTSRRVYLSIEQATSNQASVELYDLAGRLLQQWSDPIVQQGRSILAYDVSAYEAGIYIMQIAIGNERTTHRVMISQ